MSKKDIEKENEFGERVSVHKLDPASLAEVASKKGISPSKPPYKNSKLKLQKEIFLSLIAEGASFTHAAEMLGVSYGMAHRWRSDDEVFQLDLLKAAATFKLNHIRNISKHSEMDWKASKFLLERKFPEEFGEKTYQQVEQVGQKEDSFAAKILQQLIPNVGGNQPPAAPVQNEPISPYEVSPIKSDADDVDFVDSLYPDDIDEDFYEQEED